MSNTTLERLRRKQREAPGPRRAKPCECKVPVSYLDADGERWCCCGRPLRKGQE